ncbi:HPF/RaiA family ribosome-associated protein [Pseudohalioglobus lutimaris]|uniref:30S ribosomal protein S30 n=1 Tax=Pseudohalioglobus lutimaris TaxID=1737061 RepID=A0A2N5X8A4_9GAMM|nr:HPF/RaiA family ribosome-associated protein [Pseudohalioglobus lutimaris]PLW70706.1 30S ribosomal protein S30 [Pseudohalioglobus lutimaris]
MNIDIQARDFELTDALAQHVRRRLDFALSPRYEQIQQIQVRLGDVNGPRGGKDKCCHLYIVLPRMQDVVVEDTEVDMYVAINRAIDRAGRSVSRRLARQRVRPPRNAQPTFADPAWTDQDDHSLMQA